MVCVKVILGYILVFEMFHTIFSKMTYDNNGRRWLE